MENTSNLELSVNHGVNNLQQVFPIRKSLDELDMMDVFLFEAATENVENAKKLQRLLSSVPRGKR